MSKIPEIWEEFYGDDPMPEEFQPIIKILTVWVERKYKKKLELQSKSIKKLEKKIKEMENKRFIRRSKRKSKDREKSKSDSKSDSKSNRKSDRKKDPKTPPKSSIIYTQPSGTVIVSVYNNAYLIHGNTFCCRDVIKEYTTHFSRVYGGWVIPRVLTITEKHKLMEKLAKVAGRILPNIKDTDLEFSMEAFIKKSSQKDDTKNKLNKKKIEI